MKLCACKGGPDTFGPNNIAAKKAASLDPRMSGLVTRYLDMWYAKGGDQFNWFVLGASNFDTPYGTWALTDNLRELRQPKELGYDIVRSAPRAKLSAGSALPGEIDARDFSGANEPQTNPFIRYIGRGSKFDYLVRVAQTGRYLLRVSIDADKPGTKLDILVNNSSVQTIDVPARDANGPEDTFRDTAPITLLLPAGLSVIRLHVPAERPYNINSLKVTRQDGTGIAAAQPIFGGFQFFWQQVTSPGKPVTQQFSVSDAKTPASGLLVSARSDNPKLLPESNLVLVRDPKNASKFTFTATPEPGKIGEANLNFTVRNAAGLTRSAQVRIIVR